MFTKEVLEACWENVRNYRSPFSALQILSMMKTSDADVIQVTELIESTLPRAFDSRDLPTLVAIMKYLATIPIKNRPSISLFVHYLRNILLGTVCLDNSTSTGYWFQLCEETTHVVFAYHPSPEYLLANIIVEVYGGLTNVFGDYSNCSPFPLARFLFLLGQLALNTLLYSESLSKTAKIANESRATSLDTHDNEADAMEAEMGLAAAADADHERVIKY